MPRHLLHIVCLAILGLAMSAVPVSAQTTTGPSFACPATGDVAQAICADAQLAEQDRALDTLYRAALTDSLGSGPSGQKQIQRAFLRDRDTACSGDAWKAGNASRAVCIAQKTDSRLADLASTDLLRRPDIALPLLKRLTPGTAPFYEAVALYATTPDENRRTEAVAAVLTSGFTDPFMNLGITTPRLAAASADDLARYIAITTVMRTSGQFTWPCDALRRNPGLIEGQGSFFASHMDGSVPRSDCAVMLPAVSPLDAVLTAFQTTQPECEGTIRFTAAARYDRDRDAVRLHLMDRLSGREGKPPVDKQPFGRTHHAQLAAATEALAAYYTGPLKIAAEKAHRDAHHAVAVLINDLVDPCE